jgi:hypothetical protein
MKPNGTEATTRGKWSNRGEYDRFYQYPQRSQRAVAKDELCRQERRDAQQSDNFEVSLPIELQEEEFIDGMIRWLEEHDPERPI